MASSYEDWKKLGLPKNLQRLLAAAAVRAPTARQVRRDREPPALRPEPPLEHDGPAGGRASLAGAV
eukprot:11255166-Heterocapsa_arctica.AAC.1